MTVALRWTHTTVTAAEDSWVMASWSMSTVRDASSSELKDLPPSSSGGDGP